MIGQNPKVIIEVRKPSLYCLWKTISPLTLSITSYLYRSGAKTWEDKPGYFSTTNIWLFEPVFRSPPHLEMCSDHSNPVWNRFTYSNLTLNIGNMGGNIFVNFFLLAVVEAPGYALGMLLMVSWNHYNWGNDRRYYYCSNFPRIEWVDDGVKFYS